jgi:hypothetical protein
MKAFSPALVGERHNMLVVIDALDNSRAKDRKALFVCDCGKTKAIQLRAVRSGRTVSCGCMRSQEKVTHGHARRGKETATHKSWSAMLRRCENSTCTEFSLYGGRGITVDISWHSYANFLADMGERPKGKSLDRVDNNSGYSKGNCRWATPKEQANNTRTTTIITHDGVSKPIGEWAEDLGLRKSSLRMRLKLWSKQEALTASPGSVRHCSAHF